MDRSVESGQESTGWREASGIGKGPRDGNRTRDTASTVALAICRRTNHEAIGADMHSDN